MKLLGVIKDNNYIDYLNCGLDGIIFPLKDFSVDYFKYFSLDEIQEYKSRTKKKCYVIINKLIFNKKLNMLLFTLKKLEELKVDGVFFYDLAVVNLVKENNININLIFNQTHMVMNSDTINLYYNLGVSSAYLSNEITKEEILNIRNNTKSSLFVLLLGNPSVAMSKRKLLTSYFANKSIKGKKELIIKEPISKQEFLVKEDDNGTTFFYNKRINLSNIYLELVSNNIDYGIIMQGNYSSLEYRKLITSFVNFDKKTIDLIAGHNRGFLYRKTIYKVKK